MKAHTLPSLNIEHRCLDWITLLTSPTTFLLDVGCVEEEGPLLHAGLGAAHRHGTEVEEGVGHEHNYA